VSLLDPGPVLTGREADFFSEARVAYFGSVTPEGAPHVVPVSPFLDLDRVVLATDGDTVKVRNVVNNPAVTLAVDDYDEDWDLLKAVLVFGWAQVIESGYEWERIKTLLYGKYPQYPEQAPIEEGTTVMLDIRIDRVVTWGF
jgi:nitroimidazol reductase NimA-like FMN-containing flavoprotein (pyridoxamine 5'-phosphate oxidase superfamily)